MQAEQKLGGGQVHIVVLVWNALGWGDPIIQQCKTLAGLLDDDDSGADYAAFVLVPLIVDVPI